MKNIKILFFLVFWLLIGLPCAQGDDDFIVRKIRPEGLRYISVGTFLTYIPVKEGDHFDQSKSIDIIRALYKSGFFDNVSIYREGNVLVVKVVERPIISTVKITGNKKIATTQIDDALKQSGCVAGQILDNSVLINFEQALKRQYYSLGYYGLKIETKVIPREQGRVEIDMNIYEGPVAKIKSINIIGNNKFKTKTLLKEFSLSAGGLLSWFTDDNQYSKEKLDADLEKLRSYYLDHGYLQFKIDSSEVSITPDKKHASIVIHVTEGAPYTVSGFSFSGELLGQEKKLTELVDIKAGEVFSRRKIINVNQRMIMLLSDMGYAFANIKPETKVNDHDHQITVNFVVVPGQKIYLHRLSFIGNYKTSETVLRREMRQMEGGLLSNTKLEESKRLLYNLGYLKNVESQIKPVEGTNNQVDVQYTVEEDSSSAAFSFNVGYSDLDSFFYSASITDRNFMGSGKTAGVQFNSGNYTKVYSINYFDPYFTDDHVSLGFSAYSKMTDQADINNTSSYSVDATGATINHGFQISEYSRLYFGYGYENTRINPTNGSPYEILDFIDQYGRIFDLFKVHASWQLNHLDRYMFPRQGFSEVLAAEASVPIFQRAADYYKINYDAKAYYPLLKYFVGSAKVFLGYGDGYGNMDELPFFANYFGGGLGSVRGYQTSTLGPKDSYGNAIGGNISVYGSLGLILPNPSFVGDRFRTTLFIDAGNIYQSHSDYYKLDLDKLRYSAGIQFEIHSIIPVTLSFGVPLDKRIEDRKQAFQFMISLSP